MKPIFRQATTDRSTSWAAGLEDALFRGHPGYPDNWWDEFSASACFAHESDPRVSHPYTRDVCEEEWKEAWFAEYRAWIRGYHEEETREL
jgi:hypothetical protein